MSIHPLVRVFREYQALRRVLSAEDLRAYFSQAIRNIPRVLRTKTLGVVDAAMARDLEIHYHDHRFVIPLANIDAILAPYCDNPTFGNLREMYANDCYLRHFRLTLPIRVVLDLGANRGLFTLIALIVLNADIVLAVEPLAVYEPIMQLLLDANGCTSSHVIRYNKYIASSPTEQESSGKHISINAIREQNNIARFGMVKVDIEGGEIDIFSEPAWLSHVDNLTMELHHFAGNLELISENLKEYGFRYIATDQFGQACHFKDAMFLYASCTGSLC
jgi:hypothetical protein